MAAAAPVRITICPPMSAKGVHEARPTFGRKQVLPVHLTKETEDGFERGLSFDDHTRMQTKTNKRGAGFGGERMLPTPDWTRNPTDVRRVLLAYFEMRFGSRARSEGLSELERFARVFEKLKTALPRLGRRTDRLCEQYVAEQDAQRKRSLSRQVEILDRQLILASRPDALFDVIHLYYSMHMTSVAISEQLNGVVSPTSVRQLLHRLNKIASALGYVVAQDTRRRRDRAAVGTSKQKLLRVQGLCRCGALSEAGRKSCRLCLDNWKDYAKEQRANDKAAALAAA